MTMCSSNAAPDQTSKTHAEENRGGRQASQGRDDQHVYETAVKYELLSHKLKEGDIVLRSRINTTPAIEELGYVGPKDRTDIAESIEHLRRAGNGASAVLLVSIVGVESISEEQLEGVYITKEKRDLVVNGRVFKGALGLSAIGYSNDGKTCTIQTAFSCGLTCGETHLLVMKKTDEGWQVETAIEGAVN